MSNITLFDGKFKMPALPEGFEDNITGTIAGGVGGVPRISIRGSAFRQIVGGKEVHVSEDRSLDVVIINAAPIARTYYGSDYDEDNPTPPKCWSADGLAPAADVPAKTRQHDKCASCPMNIKGSGQGDTRACRFSQRVAVLLDGEIEEQKVYQLSLPATSIFGNAEGDKMPLQAYGKFLKANGVSVAAVVTRLRFDVQSSTPKLFFKAVRPLNAEELEAVVAAKDSDDAIRAITFTVAQADGVATSTTASKTKTHQSEDDGSEEIFEEPPKKTTKKKAAPPPPVEEEEDEDYTPPSKTAKKSKPVVEEEEEEIPEPKVSKASKPAAPATRNLDDLMGDWDD